MLTGARMGQKLHWDQVYEGKGDDDLSWHQAEPSTSLDLMREAGVTTASSVIDIGGGSSRLVDRLLSHGLSDVSVLDLSDAALNAARQRLGGDADRVTWITADITTWTNARRFDLWHDRAVFHFLTDPADRAAYIARLSDSLTARGHAIIATFAPDGPTQCSGLPVTRYSPEQLADTLGKDFALIEQRYEIHQTPWGSDQSFQYSLLRKAVPHP